MTPEGTTIEALRKMSTRDLIQLIIDLREELATLPPDPYMPGARREVCGAVIKLAAQVTRERKKVSTTIAADV